MTLTNLVLNVCFIHCHVHIVFPKFAFQIWTNLGTRQFTNLALGSSNKNEIDYFFIIYLFIYFLIKLHPPTKVQKHWIHHNRWIDKCIKNTHVTFRESEPLTNASLLLPEPCYTQAFSLEAWDLLLQENKQTDRHTPHLHTHTQNHTQTMRI